MKKTIAALSVILAAGGLLADNEVEINGEFKQLNPEKTAPVGWIKMHSSHPDIGTAKIVPAREMDENALQITTYKRPTPFYTAKAYPVKPGDTIKMAADVKGKGNAGLSVYLYDKAGHIATENLAKGAAVPVKFTEVKGRCRIKETYTVKRKGETVTAVPSSVKFAFYAAPKSKVVFENVEAEIESAKK